MLEAVASYSAPFIQRTPEITKLRASVVLAFLFAETITRYQLLNPKFQRTIPTNSRERLSYPQLKIDLFKKPLEENMKGKTLPKTAKVQEAKYELFLKFFKSVQIIACLGSTRFFQPYWVFLPASGATIVLGRICPPPSLINATLLAGTIAAKVVNSFAIGLLASEPFPKIQIRESS